MAFKDKAQASKYIYEYTKDKYDRISATVPKGRKAEIQEYLRGFSPRLSVNEYINKLIDFDMAQNGDN
jgi:hypothetical protein